MKPPIPPPSQDDLWNKFSDAQSIRRIIHDAEAAPGGRYRHWDTLRHLTPPNGLTSEEWWLGIKLTRNSILRPLPLSDSNGVPFRYAAPDPVQELLHFIDQHAAGEILTPEIVAGSEGAKRHYMVNAFIEEAIRSSQLEGATTTRAVAKEMIQSGRPPKDRSERMILNNYQAMQYLHDYEETQLTPNAVIELQRMLTDETLADPSDAGRLQLPGEERVSVWDGSRILHRPPAAEELPARLDLLCRFANGEAGPEGFLHPVLRAILLHFTLAYDHPFVDGNGRTARALFYWSMRTSGFWLTEYLSISRIFRLAPSKYARAFLYTETDGGDTTYFLLYHLAVIKQAIEQLHGYMQRKIAEIREVESLVRQRKEWNLNHRQLALIGNALRHPESRYEFRQHMMAHGVSFQSARTDLLSLKNRGLLELHRVGRTYVFTPAPDLAKRLRSPTTAESIVTD
jgi:Fic family protein